MLAGVRAGASMVTPNELEAEELVGQEFADRRRPRPGSRGAGPLRRLGGGDHAAGRLRRGGRRGLRATPAGDPHRAAGAGLHRRLRGRLPGRLRRRPLREPLAGGMPRLRRRLRGRVDPALRRRHRRSQPGRAAARRGRRPRFGGPRRSVGWLFNASPGGLTWKSKLAAARKGGAHTDSTTSRSSRRAAPGTPTTSTSAGPSAPIASTCRWSRPRWTESSAPTPRCSSTSSAASECSTWRGSGPASRTPRSGWSRSPARPKHVATRLMQEIYAEPVKSELIGRRVAEIKARGAVVCGSLTPQKVREHYEVAVEAGLDILVVQGTVISAEHVSTTVEPLNLKEFIAEVPVPTVVGGCASYSTGLHLMRTGAVGVLVGVGPGAACTTRGVLGIGVPAGDRDRRRRGRPRAAHAGDRRVRERDRRRRHAHRRRRLQGDRLRRRLGDGRLAAGPRQGGARSRLPLGDGDLPSRRCPAAPGSRPSRTGRWRRSCSARPRRTTAPST